MTCADVVIVRGRAAVVVSGVVFEGSGSTGGTGGAVPGKSTRATRRCASRRDRGPPGHRDVKHDKERDPRGLRPSLGSRSSYETLSGQALKACTGSGHIRVRVLYVSE